MAGVWAVAAVALALTTACTPDAAPTPSPSPTGFASEEEAFAAAEETYRAYVDALNQVDLSDPATFEPVFELTTGELNGVDRKNLSEYHAARTTVDGASLVRVVALEEWSPESGATTLAVCLDVSQITLQDEAGNSLVSPDRQEVQPLSVSAVPGESPTGFLLARIDARTGEPTC